MKSKKSNVKYIVWLLIIVGIIAGTKYYRSRPVVLNGEEIEAKTGDINTYYSFTGSIEAKNREIIFADQSVQVKSFEVAAGDMVEIDDILYKNNRGTNVRAKMKGEILDIYVEESEQLAPGSKIMEIVDYNDLELIVKVDEYDLKSIKVDDKINVKIHALDKGIEGNVSEISKEGTYLNGVTFFNTIISIENDGDILVGMSAEANIMNKSANNVVILPMSSIKFDSENKAYVKVKQQDVLENKDIEVGITDGVNVEIKSGLNSGDIVFVEKEATNNFGPPRGARGSGGNN